MIGTRIKQARKHRGRSQKWLAIEVGVAQASVSDWETCRFYPTTDNLAKIATLLDVSFEWLATGRGEMIPTVAPPTAEIDAMVRALSGITSEQREIVLRFINDWMTTLKK